MNSKKKEILFSLLNHYKTTIEKCFYLFSVTLCFISYMIPQLKPLRIIGLLGIVFFLLPKLLAFKINLTPYNKWFFLFLIFCLLSTFWALNPYTSIWGIMQIVPLWIFNISIIRYVGNNTNRLYDVFIVFFISSVVLLIYTLFYFDFSQVGNERLSDTKQGFNGNSIAIAFSLSIYIIYVLIKSKYIHNITKPLLLGISVVMFSIILLTGSRTGLIMLILPISIYLFLKSKYKINALIGIAFLGLAGFLLIIKVPSVYNVLGKRVVEMVEILKVGQSFTGKGDNSRLILFYYGIEWFQENPILGVGINNYRVLSNVTPPFVGRNFYAHSNIIELLVGIGIIGTLIYYSFIYFILKTARKNNSQYFKIIITIGIIFIIHDIFSMSYYEYEMQFLLCVAYILSEFKQNKDLILNTKTYEEY